MKENTLTFKGSSFTKKFFRLLNLPVKSEVGGGRGTAVNICLVK